jgi:fermentation-respiration switch protein FrsA (DUF1100 family)
MVRRHSPVLHPWVRRILTGLALLYGAGTVFGGIALGWIATHPGRRPLSTAEQSQVSSYAVGNRTDFRDVTMTAGDGSVLRAWFLKPPEWNGNSVLLLHGVADNRLGMAGYGQWLIRNHYSVLLPDARAHGVSGGEIASYGLFESEDIHHWVDWLEDNVHPQCVFGFGESMGAGQVLQALFKESRFCAIVAESPFESFREVAYARFGRPFHAGPWLGRSFFWPTAEVGFLYVRMKYRLNLDAVSPREAVRNANVPVLLIHGTADRNIPSYNSDDIQAANPARVQLWKVPGAAHCGAHQVAPAEFDRRVLDWFSQPSIAGSKS